MVGDVEFAYEELAVTAEPGQALIVYTAEPGSTSQERLRLLASWAASRGTGAATDRTTSTTSEGEFA